MSRAVWFVYAAALYTMVLLGFIMLAWLVGEKVRRYNAGQKAKRDLAALRAGWTADDERRAAALLRDAE